MRKLSLIGLLLAMAVALEAQTVRTFVPLVQPVLSEEARSGFLELSKSFAKAGYDDLASTFRDRSQGGWGSGVLVTVPDDKTVYLVTNRHVAGYSDTATITFDEPGQKRVLDDLKVVYVDPRIDLAILEVPDEQIVRAYPLQLTASEGSEVWSAGFPGLGGRPEWQLAKGNITNAAVVVSELGYDADAVFLQHSAAIDPGNSGGPLLVGDPSNPTAFKVVGVNTWTARGRNNSFYSIPAAKVAEAIQRFRDLRKTDIDVTARAFESFVNAADWDKHAFRAIFSYKYGAKSGWKIFESGFDKLSPKDKSVWAERFGAAPLEAMTQFLSFQAWSRVRSGSADFVFETTEGKDGSSPISSYVFGKKTAKVHWSWEAGGWRILTIDWSDGDLSTRSNGETEAPEAPVGFSLRTSALFSIGDTWDPSVGFGLSADYESNIAGPVSLVSRFTFSQDSPGKNDTDAPRAKKYNFIEYGLGFRYYYQVPQGEDGYWAVFAGATVSLAAALPQFQPGFFDSLGGLEAVAPPVFLLGGVVEPRFGFETSWNKSLAFGADVGVRWFTLGFSGPKTLPLGFSIKWLP